MATRPDPVILATILKRYLESDVIRIDDTYVPRLVYEDADVRRERSRHLSSVATFIALAFDDTTVITEDDGPATVPAVEQ